MPSNDFQCRFRIYYEDTDLSGVVYHANYLRYFERARTDLLRAIGFNQSELRDQQDLVFTISGLDVKFRQPARLDDLITVTARAEARRASVRFEQSIFREADRALLASATVRAGCVSFSTFRPIRMPENIRSALTKVVQ